MYKWSLYAGSITRKVYPWGSVKRGLYKQVILIYRWSLDQVWLYNVSTIVSHVLIIVSLRLYHLYSAHFYNCIQYALLSLGQNLPKNQILIEHNNIQLFYHLKVIFKVKFSSAYTA